MTNSVESTYLLICCTCPTEALAHSLAEQLVSAQLAACVNILPQIQSVYRWQGKLEKSLEQLLMIKTTAQNYSEIEEFILAHHPYEVPEIIALPIVQGEPRYLQWLGDRCTK